jgi:uncharacterized membrane protein YkoI
MRIFLISIVAMLLLGHAAVAQGDHDQARRALKSGKIIALTEILTQVEQRFEGRVVEVELIQDRTPDESFVYKVELLTTAGNLIEIFFDARTGAPIAMGGQGFIDDRTEEE